MTDDGDAIRVNPKQLWPVAAYPSIRVDKILDDLIQLRLGGEPIVDGNDRVARVEVFVGLNGIQTPAVAHDEGATMNPQDSRRWGVARLPIDVSPNAKIAYRLVRVGSSCHLLALDVLRAGDRQHQHEYRSQMNPQVVHGASIMRDGTVVSTAAVGGIRCRRHGSELPPVAPMHRHSSVRRCNAAGRESRSPTMTRSCGRHGQAPDGGRRARCNRASSGAAVII
jgi:hypothetical protein